MTLTKLPKHVMCMMPRFRPNIRRKTKARFDTSFHTFGFERLGFFLRFGFVYSALGVHLTGFGVDFSASLRSVSIVALSTTPPDLLHGVSAFGEWGALEWLLLINQPPIGVMPGLYGRLDSPCGALH